MNLVEVGNASKSLKELVDEVVNETPIFDIHTHLYDPAFGDLLLWGIDELLIYHYLVAEGFRFHEIPPSVFWKLSKLEQADLLWKTLFLDNSPISEACRGVLTTLQQLGIDAKPRDLRKIRQWFKKISVEEFLDRCLQTANVRSICMTNSPFDPAERATWKTKFSRDPRFVAALRIDPLLLSWEESWRAVAEQGFPVSRDLTEKTIAGARKFLESWAGKMDARYLMVSLPPTFAYPADTLSARLLESAVLPVCRDLKLPLAVMPGVRRQVNPALRLAGDGCGLTQLDFLANLCQQHAENKFMATVLARENQHELCVLARKFSNLHIFGCWWFTNTPTLIDEMTRMRLELLGFSFTAQHSDARVLDQVVYKWSHTRKVVSRVLADKYSDLQATGWQTTRREIARDVQLLFGGAFQKFLDR